MSAITLSAIALSFAAGLSTPTLLFFASKRRKHGALTFGKLGRLNFSYSLSRRKIDRATTARAIARYMDATTHATI